MIPERQWNDFWTTLLSCENHAYTEISGLNQTSFDQLFITTCFMWLLTTTILRQTNDGHKCENKARHHNFRTKMKTMSCQGACSSCAEISEYLGLLG